MKKFLLIILPVFALVSCFKGESDLGKDYSGEGYLKYLINGVPYEYTGGAKSYADRGIGVYAKKQLKSATVPNTRYTITAQLAVNKLINIVIVTDSLKTGSYVTSPSASAVTSFKIDSTTYSNNRGNDFLNITISKYSGGIIEGTITGQLSAVKTENGTTTYNTAQITDGIFQNVVMQYP